MKFDTAERFFSNFLQDELLGRVSPSFEDITFSFHVRLESYQRSLIIVSTYDDFEMEEIRKHVVGDVSVGLEFKS